MGYGFNSAEKVIAPLLGNALGVGDKLAFGHFALRHVAGAAARHAIFRGISLSAVTAINAVVRKARVAFGLLEVPRRVTAIMASAAHKTVNLIKAKLPINPTVTGVSFVLKDDLINYAPVARKPTALRSVLGKAAAASRISRPHRGPMNYLFCATLTPNVIKTAVTLVVVAVTKNDKLAKPVAFANKMGGYVARH